MKSHRILTGELLVLAALLPAALRAQVKAELVAAQTAIQPGRPLVVALHLEHEPHWHTYWLNPGTGLTTSLAWKLPAGFTAGSIQWPAPHVMKDATGTVTGNGYEGDIFLPVEITPPAQLRPGDKITLVADAEWLMCQDVCKPGSAHLSLTLPVSADPPTPDPRWGAPIARTIASLPRPLPEWSVTATRDAKTVILALQPTAGSPGLPGVAADRLHFFSDDGFVAYELPQDIRPDGHGGFRFTLPISQEGPPTPARLLGVVTAEAGWAADGSLRGLRIGVPLGIAAPHGATAGPASRLPNANSGSATGGLPGTVLLAFIGGLILNLMPCVFPVLGIKILGFVNQSGHDRRKITLHGLAFSLGVLGSFWVLAGLLALLRAGGDQLGWGFQLQSPGFVFALAALLLVFALSLSGVFEFGLRATGVGAGLQMRQGLSGSFFTGVLATVVATPCSAPFLAPALGAALALPTAESFVVFTAIALGLSLPYLALSLLPDAVKVLPRPGAWMETFKQLMAFPLYATVGYLVWVLAGQTSDTALLNVLFGLTAVAMAAWLYGRLHAPGARPAWARLGKLGGLALLVVGAWLGWPRAAAATDPVWEPWSPERVAQLQAEGRPVFVDFTARWCATCQANKRLVFHSADVLQAFAARKVATLRGDWTNRDPQITAELARWGRSAVPFNLIYAPGQPDPVVLPELLTPGKVLAALAQAEQR